ncbi:WYL domain-containing protein [uncultured Polaribacter sp.]|uniref:helix-turn-helix transcriptional regulator n=1 Tax=uncultured Polaribacter sp. TaxID=174711 RepID=UPI00259B401C|nr:WYL domain-containing protein [uncultured Polaribacter sp.]
MPINKHQIIRYQALDKCFRNNGKRYFIEDLIGACNDAIYNFSGNSDGVQKRQIYDDIAFMLSEDGYAAPIEKNKVGRKVYYFYTDINFTINNQPLTESEALELKETLVTLNRFKGLPQFEWIESMTTRLEASFQFGIDANQIIEFDQNEFLKGKEHIKDLYHSITNKTPLTISYKSFSANTEVEIELHPYYLKQYNNRWFVFGKNPKYDNITNLALDRISKIELLEANFINTDIDFQEYFEDIIGVTFSNEFQSEAIIVRVDIGLWPYIETKPLHGSQKVVNKTDEFVDIKLELIPNYEFESLILQYGEKIVVLEPKHLKEKIQDRIKQLIKKYNCAD